MRPLKKATPATDLTSPEVKTAIAHAKSLAVRVGNYVVKTAEQYEDAGGELLKIKEASTKLEKLRKGITQPLDAAKKAVMDLFRGPTTELEQAERAVKGAMIVYSDEQERKRKEEQARADALAEQERERLEKLAKKAERQGNDLKVAVLEERARNVEPEFIATKTPYVAGVQVRETWDFIIEDPKLVPDEYKVVDEVKIRKVVNVLKEGTNIPGVRVFSKRGISAGAGK